VRIVFRPLFRLRVRHGWYPTGDVREDDFEVVPTRSTAGLLTELGLRTRTHVDGITVFAEVEPGTTPPVLMRPVGAGSLRLVFELRARRPNLLNIAELPPFQAGRTVFCLDNLREDLASGHTLLGDAVANARIGPALTLVPRHIYEHSFAAPVTTATLTIRNRFGATVATIDVRSPDLVAPIAAYRLDLSAVVPVLAAGRYQIADDQGTSAAIYYDPELAPSRPLGVIEIYSHTISLTPDASDRVPASYRFLAGDTLTGFAAYSIQFDALATTWRYIVMKKYVNNPIALGDLAIAGPVAFAGAVAGDRAVFTSATALRLAEARRTFTLKAASEDIRELPEPDLRTPLGRGATATSFVSEMFVYV
jgi:hypothetical protein